ncbi:MAG: TRAP transporter large permease [Pseudomonadota bacterium]|nr:TRAP transporter large permease [Pseudomonadota bacterium]
MISAILAFAGALALIMMRFPIAIALAGVGLFGLYMNMGLVPSRTMLGMAAQSSTMGYSLSVLPLFVLMGNLVAGAGISGSLFHSAQLFLSRRKGGLAMASIVASGAFGAICGSSVATAATMSRVALPPMRKFGYADRLSAASVAAGGTLGILIPPSVIMVVYAVTTQSHIGMLFAAGLVPGLIGIVLYIVAIKWVVWRRPETAPQVEAVGWRERFGSLSAIWPVILLFGLVMGGIYTGQFTATEAAGIGAFGALIFAIFSRKLTFKQIWVIIIDSGLVSASLFAILFGASMFVEFLNLTGVHSYLETFINDSGLSPTGVIISIIVIYIILGCVLESISMMLITVPILFPVVIALGYDPIWFGILVVVASEIGLITPPIGINLFVIRSSVPNLKMGDMFRGIVPFVAVDIVRIAIIAIFPGLVMWLPQLLF